MTKDPSQSGPAARGAAPRQDQPDPAEKLVLFRSSAPERPPQPEGPAAPSDQPDPARIAEAPETGAQLPARVVQTPPAARPKGKPGPKAKPKGKPKPKPKPEAKSAPVPEPASAARPRGRHLLILVSFLLLVLTPVSAAAWYLWARSADQFTSELGFTVRREETSSPVDFLGGLSNLSSSGSSDTDVLYEYIQSQEMVRGVDEKLGLRSLYSEHYATDPVFSFHPDGSIEDLVAYWRRMVQVSYNPGSGMLEMHVFAFDPDTAKRIAEEILRDSSRLINDISAIARQDATRYAQEDLEAAKQQLKAAREALTAFRSRTRIVDPSADLQGQMGLLTTLQQQLASTLIDLDLLQQTTSEQDPRIAQAQRRIEVIRNRIEQERSKFAQGGAGAAGQDYATLVAEFERLAVDREFAEQTYTAALSGFASARAAAERQSRYLAAFVRPTLAETARYPRRIMLLGLAMLFLTLAWSILVLVYYSLRDRQ